MANCRMGSGAAGWLESFRVENSALRNSSFRLNLKPCAFQCRSSVRDCGSSSSNSNDSRPMAASLSRRVAVLSLLAAPSVLSAAASPPSRALELPLKDEFDQEEDSLIELFSVRSSCHACKTC